MSIARLAKTVWDVPHLGQFSSRFVAEYFGGHLGSITEDFEDQHGSYVYLVKKKDGQRILEFCTAMKVGNTVRVGNTVILKKRLSHLVTFESSPSQKSRRLLSGKEGPKKKEVCERYELYT